ncbi:hypothetical protein Vi05172_g9984 [Venturia inaequalis]|nr:hypothetical protein Vi05172_g9984 [Venturia inaequalis]
MALNPRSLYYATLSLGVFTFVALTCFALSDGWRPHSLAVTPTPRRSLPNITTVCPTTPPGSDEYQFHLSHINKTIQHFCSLPHLQKSTFVPAIYTFPPWRGVRSLYPNKGEEYPFPASRVRFAISFSDSKTLEGNCGNGWVFERSTCVEGLRKQWEGRCNITSRVLPDPATFQSMATTTHQGNSSKRDNQPTSDCVSFHVTSAPSNIPLSKSPIANTTDNVDTKARAKPKSFHLDIVFTDSSQFSMDEESIMCSPERKDLKEKESGWCVCWFEGMEGQRRRFWPASGDMTCWNLMPWTWRPGLGVGRERGGI